MEEKIAPESSNTYKFVVKNNTIYNVKYAINFIEENDYNINMKYRLRKGNEYVVGSDDEWVSYNELNLKDINLATSKSETYYLDWKWVSSENDTQVGSAEDAGYKLSIEINSEHK